ncbi:MAG: ComF family protein [Candidatus Sulfotelmatobacter sp.]
MLSGPPGYNFADNTEAVFSSSEDRIRASQAKAAVASHSIASSQPGWSGVANDGNDGWTHQLAVSLFSVLFPSDCRICGTPLVKISRLPVCQECLDAMRPIAGGVCAICGERIFSPYAGTAGTGEPRCGVCRRIEPPFVRAVAYGSYESGLRELIHLLKFGGMRPAANILGRMLAEAIGVLAPEFPAESVSMIPVPLHRSKIRQRGFNQAELIARAAMKNLAPSARLHLSVGVLERTRETVSQIGLTSHQRRINLRGAFRVAQPEAVKGREVLVIDDVYTTGATVSECARVLRRAGATRVWVATVARTLKISAQHAEIEPDIEIESDDLNPANVAPLAKAAGI